MDGSVLVIGLMVKKEGQENSYFEKLSAFKILQKTKKLILTLILTQKICIQKINHTIRIPGH